MQKMEIDNQGQRGLQELDTLQGNNYVWCKHGHAHMQCSEILFSLHVHAGLRHVAALPMLNKESYHADHTER